MTDGECMAYIFRQIQKSYYMQKVAISGYFDPIHIGHLEYIKMARELGDYLIVIVNNDKQAALKKGKVFYVRR